eukprot:3556346-Rhodomonas_salina.5
MPYVSTGHPPSSATRREIKQASGTKCRALARKKGLNLARHLARKGGHVSRCPENTRAESLRKATAGSDSH